MPVITEKSLEAVQLINKNINILIFLFVLFSRKINDYKQKN